MASLLSWLVGLYIANVLTFKRITTFMCYVLYLTSWTLYCKCTNFQANHNLDAQIRNIDAVGLYIANVLTFKRITTIWLNLINIISWTLYCKCTNFQANHNSKYNSVIDWCVGLYIANVLTFKRITTNSRLQHLDVELDSILQMY